MRPEGRWRLALGITGALTLVGFAATLKRVPTPWPDSELYASIARSWQLHGVGVPSSIEYSPHAVDHVPFYGPVFFELVARSYTVFGVSLGSFRLVNLVGAILLATAGAALARSLSGTRNGSLCAFTLLLLTPEVSAAATSGDMETVAVGLEVAALAILVQGLVSGRRDYWHGFAAGVLLTLAALTTPRTYPFVFAVFAAGLLLPPMPLEHRLTIRRQLAVTAVVLGGGLIVWATSYHGSPIRWVRYMMFIFTREDFDVAILPGAVREWSFGWSSIITPAIAAAGAIVAAAALSQRQITPGRDTSASMFALATCWITAVITVSVMNLTLTCGMYFALPLLAVVLATPRRHLNVSPTLGMAVVAGMLACGVGLAALKYVRVAATWAARDPEPLYAFIRAHVPPGSAVIGPDSLYFFAAEHNGARFRSVSTHSMADWARWVPHFDPTATSVTRRFQTTPPTARFFIWPTADELPSDYACSGDHLVGVYVPPPHNLKRLGSFGDVWDAGYPETALYRLPSGCPTGYDPSGGDGKS